MIQLKKIIIVAAAASVGGPVLALEIDPNVVPEITLGGRGIATAEGHHEEAPLDQTSTASAMDTADSSLLFGFSKYLFSDRDYGFSVFGFKTPEEGSDLPDGLYVHELHVGVGGNRYEVKLGRSRLPNTLVQFPTLRDDDLLEYTHVPNGQIGAEAEEYQIFGNQVLGSWWFTPSVRLSAGLTARTEQLELANPARTGEFNGAALGLMYDVPEAIKFDRGLRFAGLLLDHQQLDAVTGRGLPEEELTSLVAGFSYVLSNNPEASWALDAQAIIHDGVAVDGLDEPLYRHRAQSRAVVASLRYAHRPYLQTRWQAALTAGWKEYRDFDEATSYTIAPSFVYRLGSGVDLVSQYVYRHNADTLARAVDVEDAHRIQLGLTFAFDHTFNETVGQRGSILNLEHNMLDIGPAGGGH